MAGSLKGIILEIGGDTSGLQKALNKVNSASSSLSKELKGVNSLLKLDPKNVELLEQKQTLLNQSIETTQDKLDQLKKIKDEADKKMAQGTKISEENYRNLQREIINTQNKLNGLTDDLKQFNAQNSNWTKAGKKVEEYGNKITKVSNKVDEIGNKAMVASAGVIAGGTALANSAMNLEDAVAKYVASTNTATDETEKYKGILEEINKNNYGDGYEDIANSMASVKMQLKDLNEQDLQNITEKAIALRDMFGYEVAESVRAVKAMMDNFNVSADEAFNLIAEGKKQGLDFSNELLDNVNEYSVQFKKLGLSAQDMFNIFKVGADNGAFNLDKIGDAVKEFSIRAIDGSNTTIDGFKRIGLNADTMAKKFANGGEEAKKAFIEVVNRLGSMDDKVSQSIAGVDLFGTMWEDLGPTVVTSFSKMDNGISQSSDTMQKSIDELYNTTKKKAETQLKRLQSLGADFGEEMLPVLEDLIDLAEKFTKELEGMSDEEKENIAKIALLVAGAGPLIKTLGTLGKGVGTVSKGLGIFSQALSVAKGKTTSTETSVNNLAQGFKAIISPVGLASIGISLAIATITTAIRNAEKETKEAFSNIGNSATDFITGIDNATSHLDSFNSTLFASSEEQQKLQEDMDDVQQGITEICKRASDERRGYTQEEITQLDEYFTKLRELKNRELEIQKSISSAITQQATQNAQSFNGNLEEYKVSSQEWIKTAQEQAEKQIGIIDERTTQEIALLQQKYGEKATLENEEYSKEYNKIVEQKNIAIQEANDQVAKVNEAYANGYLQRASQNNGFYDTLQEYNAKVEEENTRHNLAIKGIEDNALLTQYNKNRSKSDEEYRHKEEMKDIWNDMYKNMSDEQAKELGTWLAMVAQTEMYGGEISDETKETVDSIIESYDSMPKETKEAMEDAMKPMLEEMENKKPSLFAKANSIANGIVSRLSKAFDINAPSTTTSTKQLPGHKNGLDYVPYDNYVARLHKGERVLTAKQNKQLMSVDKASKLKGTNLERLANNTLNKNNFYFNLQINPKSLTESDMRKCFDYWRREAGKYI